MKLERRDFLRAASTGLALGCADRARCLGQVSGGNVTEKLQASSGTLRLEGKLKSGLLRFEAQDFIDRADRCLVIRGNLDSAELYSATFSYQKDLTAFALFHDGEHSTTMTLCNSEQAKIGRLVVWNDNEIPQIFRIDKNKVMDKDDLKGLVDADGKALTDKGRRVVPILDPGVKVTQKNFGRDRRYPITNRFRDMGEVLSEPDEKLVSRAGSASAEAFDG